MEIEERMRFVLKVRESQSQAIAVLSMTPFDYGIYNPGNTWRTMGEPKIDPFSYGATPSVDTPNRDNGNGKRSPDELSGTGISSSSIASHNQK